MLYPKPVRRQKRRGHEDPVRPEDVARVLARDRGCVAAQIDPAHECRDAFGWPHRWDDLAKMTMEHVQEGYGRMAKRASSRPEHMVAMCHAGNLTWGPTHRDAERAWLATRG